MGRGRGKFAPVVVTFIGLATWIKLSCPKLIKAFVKLSGGPVEPAECVSKIGDDFRPDLPIGSSQQVVGGV